MPPNSDIAAVQFSRLSTAQRCTLAGEVFNVLEYGAPNPVDGDPGVEWGSDTTKALGTLLGSYGVTFTSPDDVPAGYRYNAHRATDAAPCPWSLRPAPSPQRWAADAGPPWCPAGCLGSVIEPDPNAEPEMSDASDDEE